MMSFFGMGIPDEMLDDPYYDDKVETLPCGNMMLRPHIRAMREGKDFSYFATLGSKGRREAKGLSIGTFNNWYMIWDKTRRFGLPNGEGWANEDWFTLAILSKLDETSDLLKSWAEQERT